ncbi:RidA family protein [Sulfitobacter sp. CW3]|uniref:RidA family protein n=1 Tax=Sulfitobacter sp. CW3 TaxID=2861965 RepID=UPI001C5D1A8D|nr:RidA family protein [Sulfitobacter sp. CW3]MBW4961062.1 RidA family protein [Sulfitobacter sp. CW3]
MSITRLHPGPRMSQAVIHNNTVYLAGQVGTAGADIDTQTQDCLDAIDALLAEVGSDKSKMLQVIIWLSDMSDFAAMNAVYDAWVDPANLAVRACGEAKLATPEYRVEFIVTAAI